ncbi:MAG: ACT domain-containing protein [Desulfovibrionaceae bacterium]|nr:ACT domain-containing protein [Desulfovibrionaceae bacterium]
MAAQLNQYKTEQISIFLENRAGRLAEVTSALSQAGLNLRALSLADTSDFGILRMIVCDTQKAQALLKEKGFTLGITSVVAVNVDDRPGGLDELLQLITRQKINVEYMYAFVTKVSHSATMIFRFDKVDEAIACLLENKVEILSPDKICGI